MGQSRDTREHHKKPAAGRRAQARAKTPPPAEPPPPVKRVPLAYVIVGVTVYCAMIWAVAIVSIGAGARALFPSSESFADSALEPPEAEAKEKE